MRVTASRQTGISSGIHYPAGVFDQVTDVLADLLLADVQQFPQVLADAVIDRITGQENTSPRTPPRGDE
jgi:hypothetical protein